MNDDFDWSSRNPDVVVPSVGAIAVYVNQNNQVVVRQEGFLNQSDDVWVVIPVSEIPRVIEAMIRARDEANAAQKDESGS